MAPNCVTDADVKGELDVGQSVMAYKHDGRIVTVLRQATDGFELGYLVQAGVTPEDVKYTVVTGYGRMTYEGADAQITEISCHAKGTAFFNSD